MATTTYILTCLSPAHIGTGTQFSKFDGAYQDMQWYLVDVDKTLEYGIDADELARAMNDRTFSWAAWLQERKVSPLAVASYALPCPQNPEDVPVREMMKTVHQQPYVPGTSVKGAIRTAVLWSLLMQDQRLLQEATDYLALRLRSFELLQTLDRIEGSTRKYSDPQVHERAIAEVFGHERARELCNALSNALNKQLDQLQRSDFERFAEWHWRRQRVEPNPRSLDDPIERFVIGRTPNRDLMRAVQVSDSAPMPTEYLAVGLIWTYTLRGNQLMEKRGQGSEYKAFAEWLIPNTTLHLTIKLDEFLFTDAANRDLRFRGPKEQTVCQLARTCNDYARAIITTEKAFYTAHGLDALHDFYADLETAQNALPDGAFLLNIGWGGGWEVKTIGDLIRTALGDDGFSQLRQRYRLGVDPRTGQMHLNAPFPKTRRVAYEGGAPRWPLGWIKMEPQEP